MIEKVLKEFDKFVNTDDEWHKTTPEQVRYFIRQSFTEYRSELAAKIKGTKLACHGGSWEHHCIKCTEAQTYNKALDQVLKILEL